MTDHVESFMNNEIGLDVKNSNDQDVLELSRIIDENYDGIINHDVYDDMNLYEYWKECFTENWNVCIFETRISQFNAYRDDSYERYRKCHNIMTAGEILSSNNFEQCKIEEDELIDLLAVG